MCVHIPYFNLLGNTRTPPDQVHKYKVIHQANIIRDRQKDKGMQLE
jgi:hypothetical protein